MVVLVLMRSYVGSMVLLMYIAAYFVNEFEIFLSGLDDRLTRNENIYKRLKRDRPDKKISNSFTKYAAMYISNTILPT